MKCITEIKKIIFDLKVDIRIAEIKAEGIVSEFDHTRIAEIQLREDVLKSLNEIVATYEFVLEQYNK